MKKPNIIYGLLITLTFIAGSALAQTATNEKILRIAGWDVYADPEKQNKTIGYKTFEEQSGYAIEFTALTNLDEIISYAETETDIDVLIISNEGIKTLYKMNLAHDIDLQKISNYQDLHHSLQYNQWSQFEGKIYAVPWAWGPTGLLYDSEKKSEPESWNILWNSEYKNRVALWNDISMIWTAALALGYKNVYNLTHNQLDEVRKKLLQLNNQVHSYYSGEQEEIELLRSGKVTLTNSWFNPSRRLTKHNKQFKMVIPKEGAVGMFDSYMISHNCKLKEIDRKSVV